MIYLTPQSIARTPLPTTSISTSVGRASTSSIKNSHTLQGGVCHTSYLQPYHYTLHESRPSLCVKATSSDSQV